MSKKTKKGSSTPPKKKCNGMHLLERIQHDAVVELNGHGKLKPAFRCSTCLTVFYEIATD